MEGATLAKAVFRIEHRLGIPAPAHVVWQVLADLERWGEWNPLYPKADGKLRIGAELALTEVLPESEPAEITATVVDWVPEEQILWRLSQSRGFLKRLRYFEIEALSREGCIFANGEDWYGRPARKVPRERRRAMREAFAALGEALSARALASWREQAGAPTSQAG